MRGERFGVLGVLACLTVLVVDGCAPVTGPSASIVQEEITRANRAFEEAARRGDAARIASFYTLDAIAFPPDAPMVKGRDNIRQLWGSVITGHGLKSIVLKTVDLEVAGDTAYEVGEAALSLAPPGGTTTLKYVVVWKKVGGEWKLHRDIWNAMPPR